MTNYRNIHVGGCAATILASDKRPSMRRLQTFPDYRSTLLVLVQYEQSLVRCTEDRGGVSL